MANGGNVAETGDGGNLILVGHYLKDQSFKNMGGPSGLAPKHQVDLGCDLVTRRVDAEHVEVGLKLRVQSSNGGMPLFVMELTYVGLFRPQNIPAQAVQSALLVEAPTLLFGYARDIVADVLKEGGLPSLELDAIDFAALYQADTGTTPAKGITVTSAAALPVAQKPEIRALFATNIYGAPLGVLLQDELEAACLKLAAEDEAGRIWSKAKLPRGYTSFGSIPDLAAQAPAFAALVANLDRHVAAFAQATQFDLQGRRLMLDGIWVNVLQEEGAHAAHIHPHAAVSGTYYVSVPPGGASIYFEDPRIGLMMAAPPRMDGARLENCSLVTMRPKAGNLLLWESWLRHGVEMHGDKSPRISISFNYRLEAVVRNALGG